MTAPLTPTQDDIFTALRAFILGLIDCPVIQGLGNRTSMPAGSFISMTGLFQSRLSTNVSTYIDPVTTIGTKSTTRATQYTVQIDCFGPLSSDWASIISTMFRDEYGCEAMAPNVQPLYADDPKMIALIDGEQQYEQRWSITAALQYNPITTVPQDFADELSIETIVDVEVTYPA